MLFTGTEWAGHWRGTGRVPIEARYWKYVVCGIRPDLCWDWIGPQSHFGYGSLNERLPARRTTEAHRLSWMIQHGPIPAGRFVLHTCDNPPCTNPRHLYLGSYFENAQDRETRGRSNNRRGDEHHWRTHPELIPRGERNGKARLTTADVLAIRAEWDGTRGHTQRIALRHGVRQQSIDKILQRINWRHI